MSEIDDATLLKMAEAELLGEAKKAAARHSLIGVSGWRQCPKPNKFFLTNTILQTVASNRCLSKKQEEKKNKKLKSKESERKFLKKSNSKDRANFIFKKPEKKTHSDDKKIKCDALLSKYKKLSSEKILKNMKPKKIK